MKSKSSSVKADQASFVEDDDEEDEPFVKSDAEVHYECGFNVFFLRNFVFTKRFVAYDRG